MIIWTSTFISNNVCVKATSTTSWESLLFRLYWWVSFTATATAVQLPGCNQDAGLAKRNNKISVKRGHVVHLEFSTVNYRRFYASELLLQCDKRTEKKLIASEKLLLIRKRFNCPKKFGAQISFWVCHIRDFCLAASTQHLPHLFVTLLHN